jgi:hypothetical protein
MKKQPKSNRSANKKLIVLIIAATLIVAGSCFTVQKVRTYNQAADQASLVNVRELILLAVRGVKKDAPVEAKTGDVYFPESRLYLPDPKTALPLTYLQDTGDVSDSQGELSVSLYPVPGTAGLYTASNTKELFAAVPRLQACSRGIKLVYNKFPATDTNNKFLYSVHLSNGKELDVYIEKACPELNEAAQLFKNIKSY